MEVRNKMPSTLKYPYFRDLHWFAARGLCTELSEYINTGVPPPLYLVRGLKTLLATLRIWLRETSVCITPLSILEICFPFKFKIISSLTSGRTLI